jgi:hypothetical protein
MPDTRANLLSFREFLKYFAEIYKFATSKAFSTHSIQAVTMYLLFGGRDKAVLIDILDLGATPNNKKCERVVKENWGVFRRKFLSLLKPNSHPLLSDIVVPSNQVPSRGLGSRYKPLLRRYEIRPATEQSGKRYRLYQMTERAMSEGDDAASEPIYVKRSPEGPRAGGRRARSIEKDGVHSDCDGYTGDILEHAGRYSLDLDVPGFSSRLEAYRRNALRQDTKKRSRPSHFKDYHDKRRRLPIGGSEAADFANAFKQIEDAIRGRAQNVSEVPDLPFSRTESTGLFQLRFDLSNKLQDYVSECKKALAKNKGQRDASLKDLEKKLLGQVKVMSEIVIAPKPSDSGERACLKLKYQYYQALITLINRIDNKLVANRGM